MREIAVIIVRNAHGQFLVHQRSAGRATYAGLFGLGAGGKVEERETPEIAARRELMEETEIEQTPRFLFCFEFSQGTVTQRLFIFEVCSESFGQWDTREWQSCGWLETAKVQELADRGSLCPDTKMIFEKYCKLELEK